MRLVFSASVVSVRRALLVSHDPELFVRLGLMLMTSCRV